MKTRTCRRRPSIEPLEPRALLTAGVLDPSFGNAGIVQMPASTSVGAGSATALYPQSDPGDPADAGKIVVVGNYNTGTKTDFGVVRYNPNGTLDTTFGGTGSVATSFNNYTNTPLSVAIQPDGKIVVGGAVSIKGFPSIESEFALARYNTNGTLDTTFGTGGLVTTKFTLPKGYSPYDGIWALALEPNGEILAGGFGDGGSADTAFTLALYKANGKLDTSFGSGGVVHTTLGTGATEVDVLYYVGLQTINGATKIVAIGSDQATQPGQITAVIRYNLNGSLDTSFGTNGIATFANDWATAGTLQPDGSIIAAGSVQGNQTINGHLYGYSNMSLVRFTANGSLDTSFGQGGLVQTAFLPSRDNSAATSVAVQPDGAIVAGGYSAVSTPTFSSDYLQPTLVRYTPSGQLDSTFGASGTGIVVTPVDSSPTDTGKITSLALRADGAIVTAGNTAIGGLVARYLGDPARPLQASMVAERGASGTNTPDPTLIPLVLDEPLFLNSLVSEKRRHA